MKSIMMLTLIVLLSSCGIANGQNSRETISIKTNAQCGECKDRIEEKLNYTSGIIYGELDLDTKIIEVKFKSSKISAEEVRKVISNLGYNADELPANPKAQSELPNCCQPGGHD